MTEHADHQISATLSSRDLALVGCLRALADFSQRNLSRESTEERNWRAAPPSLSASRSRRPSRRRVSSFRRIAAERPAAMWTLAGEAATF